MILIFPVNRTLETVLVLQEEYVTLTETPNDILKWRLWLKWRLQNRYTVLADEPTTTFAMSRY